MVEMNVRRSAARRAFGIGRCGLGESERVSLTRLGFLRCSHGHALGLDAHGGWNERRVRRTDVTVASWLARIAECYERLRRNRTLNCRKEETDGLNKRPVM